MNRKRGDSECHEHDRLSSMTKKIKSPILTMEKFHSNQIHHELRPVNESNNEMKLAMISNLPTQVLEHSFKHARRFRRTMQKKKILFLSP